MPLYTDENGQLKKKTAIKPSTGEKVEQLDPTHIASDEIKW